MALPTYSTGTVSVAAGGTVVTGVGGMWSGINAKQGDWISINNVATVLITEVTDTTHLQISPWPGAAQSGVSYVIYQSYIGRVVGVAAAEDVGDMLEKLHVDGLPFIVGPTETVPDPSFGDDGQMAYKPETGQWWVKTAGVWTLTTAPASGGAVLYSGAQALTAPQQKQARQNIFAAPFDAMSYNGIQINGSMDINQAVTQPLTVPAGSQTMYVIDNWQISKAGTSVLSAYQFNAGVPQRFTSAIQVAATTAQPSMGASDYVRFQTRIEGYRFARLGWGTSTAMPVTASFYIRTTLTGTYRALIHNYDASTVSAWVSFTVNASMIWQWVTVTFPPVTSGTWLTDYTLGAIFLIEIASPSTPNSVGATGQFAAITGVIMIPGSESPTEDQASSIARPFDQELTLCHRHYESWNGNASKPVGWLNAGFEPTKRKMRVAPTVAAPVVLDSANATIVANITTPDMVSFQ